MKSQLVGWISLLFCRIVTLSGPSLYTILILRPINNITQFLHHANQGGAFILRWDTFLPLINSHLHVHNSSKISRLLQAVEAAHLHQLSYNLVCDLISPFVNDRHVNVVYEHTHFLTGWWSIGGTHAFVYVTLNCALQLKKKQVYISPGRQVTAWCNQQ